MGRPYAEQSFTLQMRLVPDPSEKRFIRYYRTWPAGPKNDGTDHCAQCRTACFRKLEHQSFPAMYGSTILRQIYKEILPGLGSPCLLILPAVSAVSAVSAVWRNGPETPIWSNLSCLSIADPYIFGKPFQPAWILSVNAAHLYSKVRTKYRARRQVR